MNHRSVRFSTIWIALLAMSGRASAMHRALIDVRAAFRVDPLRGK